MTQLENHYLSRSVDKTILGLQTILVMRRRIIIYLTRCYEFNLKFGLMSIVF